MRSRAPKPAFTSLQRQYGVAPHLPLARSPKVTIVVATYNGARTLRNCLESLRRLNYPDYEVVLVDDGSTDDTPVIAAEFPFARYVRQNNQGLSVARNTGIVAARGEIVAFTDDDCRADEDWLYYLVSDLQRGGFQGVGGHNFLPPEDSPIAASVMVSPGGPAHILIDDREAEHVPGCNMAFYKTALEHIGLFDPVFRKAGDDVDVCWRLQEAGYRLGFSPSGFVWHYRRSTVKAYLKQQAGYGEAEGLLIRKHPEHFNSFGGGLWKGRIYASAYSGLLLRGPVIYRGVFATGFFQRLYTPDPVTPLLLCTGLGYHVFVNLPLAVLAAYFSPAIPMALFSLSVSVGACALAAFQAPLPSAKSRFWSRPLIGLLFFLQPIVRGWARLKWTMASQANATSGSTGNLPERPEETIYWSGGEIGRLELLHALIDRLRRGQWNLKTDTGWSDYDLELPAHLWVRLRLTTVSEELDQGRRNLRCRIRFLWSLPARMTFWSATLISLFLIERLAQTTPWIWFILPLLPLIAWWLEDEAQTQRAALGRELDAAAQDLHLVQIDPVPQEASLGEQRSPKHCSDSPPS